MRIITFLLALMLVALMNVLFVGVHYSADRAVSAETVKQRIRTAIASDNIIPEEYPWKTAGFASPLNFIGMNHRADCLMNLMAMHRNANPVLNAVNPTYFRTARDNQICDVVKALADGKVSESQLEKRSRYFFWYGAKPITQFLLTKFDYFQIYQLIRQLSYFFIALLLAAAFSRSVEAGLAFVPIAGLAIMGSGLPYNGGIVFALPYLSALALGLGYYLIQPRDEDRKAAEIFYLVFAGSVQAFFTRLDGSLVLISALLMFGVYFMDRSERRAGKRLKRMMGLMLVFYLSFVATLLIKQGFAGAFLGFDSVWSDLQARLHAWLSGLSGAGSANALGVLKALAGQYAFSILGHGGVARYVQFAGLASWAVAGLLALFFSLLRHTGRPLLDMLAFGAIGLIALARFILLPANSPEMTLFVGRYWFVVIALGMSALVWIVMRYRYRGTRTAKLVAAEEAAAVESESPAPDQTPEEKTGPVDEPAEESDKPSSEPDPEQEAEPAPEEKRVASGDRVRPQVRSEPAPDTAPDVVQEVKTETGSADAKTETTKERSRLTIDVPRFLDGS